MARYAQIVNGVVENVAESSAEFAAQQGWVLAAQAQRGDLWDGKKFTRPESQSSVEVPAVVSNAQGSTALIRAGLWAAVVAYVEGIEDPVQRALAEVALHKTAEWHRDSPFLNGMAAALGLSGTQLDELFISAQEILL